MHRKLSKSGLVAMSINLDEVDDQKAMANVRKFLKEQNATLSNFILNEKQEVWQEKLGITGVPVVFVFGRDGKLAKKFDLEIKYDEIEKLAVELLNKKP